MSDNELKILSEEIRKTILSTVSENGVIEATYTYDINGNRASLTLGNGVVTSYSYNLANWVTNLSNKNGVKIYV